MGRGCNVKVWFPECPLFGGKNTLQEHFGTKDSVRCSEFGGGRFWEVVNVLQVWDFQSVTRVLSALGSVSASRGSTILNFKLSISHLTTLPNVIGQSIFSFLDDQSKTYNTVVYQET